MHLANEFPCGFTDHANGCDVERCRGESGYRTLRTNAIVAAMTRVAFVSFGAFLMSLCTACGEDDAVEQSSPGDSASSPEPSGPTDGDAGLHNMSGAPNLPGQPMGSAGQATGGQASGGQGGDEHGGGGSAGGSLSGGGGGGNSSAGGRGPLLDAGVGPIDLDAAMPTLPPVNCSWTDADAGPFESADGGIPGLMRVLFPSAFSGDLAYAAPPLLDVDSDNRAVMITTRQDDAEHQPYPVLRWFSPEAGLVSERSYPMAAPLDAMASDDDGSIWLAGDGGLEDSFGAETFVLERPGYFVQRLGADGEPLDVFMVALDESGTVELLVPDGSGGVFVLVRQSVSQDAVAWDQLVVVHHRADGQESFRRTLGGIGGRVQANDAELLPDGRLAIVGSFDGTANFDGTELESQAVTGTTSYFNGWVAILDVGDGSVDAAARFGGTDYDVGSALAVNRNGELQLGGHVQGAGTVGGLAVSSPSAGAALAASLSTDLDGVWVHYSEEVGVILAADDGGNGPTYFAGRFESDDPEATGLYEDADAFVWAADTEGNVSTVWRGTTNGPGASQVAVDRCGGVWVAGDMRTQASLSDEFQWDGPQGVYMLYLAH